MRVGYFGSPAISAELLKALLDDGEHEVVCVVSNADRPRGRSGKPVPTEVSQVALERGLPLYRFESLKGEDAPKALAQHEAELFVVFAYGKIMPAAIFALPPEGSINLHASLLPLLRGASPIQSAVLQGFTRTGWTVQAMALKMDAGDILARNEVEIGPDDTTEDLTAKLMPEGIALVRDTLAHWPERIQARREQDHAAATYCSKIEADDARIDWSQDAVAIHNRIRAFYPKPLCWTTGPKGRLKLHRSRIATTEETVAWIEAGGISAEDRSRWTAEPGTVLVGRAGKKLKMLVVTGNGLLEVINLQPENRKPMRAADFLNGSRVASGTRLGLAEV